MFGSEAIISFIRIFHTLFTLAQDTHSPSQNTFRSRAAGGGVEDVVGGVVPAPLSVS